MQSRIHLPQCQSTNEELIRLNQDSETLLPEGILVTTDHQTAGRGQRGAVWESEPGQNLLFSLLLRPAFLTMKHAFWLSAAVAIGIKEALNEFGIEAKVKWPNDLLVGHEKIGGILIENATSGQTLDRSIVGIGLNINQTDLPPGACSMAGIKEIVFDRELVLSKVLESVFHQYYLLKKTGYQKIKPGYYAGLYKMGMVHTYSLPDSSSFSAILKGITDEGQLVLLTSNGERRFWFKEVSFDRFV